MSQFDLYAAYYDLLYQDKDYNAEVNYLERLIHAHCVESSESILELGCGTGGHAFPLAERGWSVHGIDLSDKMIEEANDRRELLKATDQARLKFETGDARTFVADKKFDAVISLFHVMSYQASDEDLAAAFHAARANLDKGGVFIFDFWYGPAVLADRPKSVVKNVENDAIRVRRKTEPVMHTEKNSVEVQFDIEISAVASSETQTIKETHNMRYWFLPELEHHLRSAKIELQGAHQWMTVKNLTDANWYGCVVGKAV